MQMTTGLNTVGLTQHQRRGYETMYDRATETVERVGQEKGSAQIDKALGHVVASGVRTLEELVGALILVDEAGLPNSKQQARALKVSLQAAIDTLNKRIK